MANVTSIQIINDGSRNVTLKAEGILDTADLASATLVDPAALFGMDNTGTVKASKLRINRIIYNVEDGLSLNLAWDGATAARIEQLTGRGDMKFHDFGGITNNATTPTGKILYSTQGWSTGAILSYSLVLEMVKEQ